MSTDKLVDFLKENFPEQAVEISYSLELVQETLKKTEQKINNRLTKLTEEKQFEQAREYINRLEEIEEYQAQVNKLVNQITDIESKENKKEKVPNYEEYKVDSKEAHSLDEDFTNKRPYGFSLKGKGRQVKTWRKMLKETCDLLIKKDKDYFLTLLKDSDLQGRKRDYLAKSSKEMNNPIKLRTGNEEEVYIETNLSANAIVNLIGTLLDKYEIDRESYKIYLRANYSELHD